MFIWEYSLPEACQLISEGKILSCNSVLPVLEREVALLFASVLFGVPTSHLYGD